jgi:murein DD-endopeptidase MepM/ murein hydrolase activator NlpD
MRRALLTLILLVAPLSTASAAAPARATIPVAGIGAANHAPEIDDGLPAAARAGFDHGAPRASASPDGAARTQLYPQYIWPLERALGDGVVIVNYVDHDPSAGIQDYMNGTWAYDGHTGTDIQLHDFTLMDRGCRIRAAAAGTVTQVVNVSPYDRNCDFNWPDSGNWIEISNGDGTYAYYLHLRYNSVTVEVGDQVSAGQMLGLVGSSGYTTGPHVHFETGDYLNGGNYTVRDPWNGPANPLPSLWVSQEPYVGNLPLRFFDLGVFTQDEEGGSIFNTTYCDIVRHIQQPLLFGANEPIVGMWFQIQGPAGDSATIEVRRPDDSIYGSFVYNLSQQARYDWFWAYFYWSPYIQPSDYGTWKLRALVHGTLSREVPFQVGASTVFGPRFSPRAGRSYRINGATQKDTLRVSPFGGPVTYSLLGAPSFVTLADSILTIGATSNQTNRSLYFQAIATDGAARRDTAWFHVVDPSKPLVDVARGGPPVASMLAPARPNPFLENTTLRYEVARRGLVTLAVYDLAGRRVRVLASGPREAGAYLASWDGRDAHGVRVKGGIYFARLESGGRASMARLALLE